METPVPPKMFSIFITGAALPESDWNVKLPVAAPAIVTVFPDATVVIPPVPTILRMFVSGTAEPLFAVNVVGISGSSDESKVKVTTFPDADVVMPLPSPTSSTFPATVAAVPESAVKVTVPEPPELDPMLPACEITTP